MYQILKYFQKRINFNSIEYKALIDIFTKIWGESVKYGDSSFQTLLYMHSLSKIFRNFFYKTNN